jgi:hypothetical protein
MGTFARTLFNAFALLCLCMPESALSGEFRKSSLGPGAPDLIEGEGELRFSGSSAAFLRNPTKPAKSSRQIEISWLA